jgi:hypothetical protein
MASFAMALPILPGQAEGIERMRDEALVGPRRSEYEESRRQMGIKRDSLGATNAYGRDSARVLRSGGSTTSAQANG